MYFPQKWPSMGWQVKNFEGRGGGGVATQKKGRGLWTKFCAMKGEVGGYMLHHVPRMGKDSMTITWESQNESFNLTTSSSLFLLRTVK